MRIAFISYLLLVVCTSTALSQDLSKSLDYVFKKSDSDSLLAVLSQWSSNVQSNEQQVQGDKYASAVYSIFNEFYTPFQLNKLGYSKQGDSIHVDKFAIVQDKIQYAIVEFPNPDTIQFIYKEDTATLAELEHKLEKDDRYFRITYEGWKYPSAKKIQEDQKVELLDFRPETGLPKNRSLYLTSDLQAELIQFLRIKHSSLCAGSKVIPDRKTKKIWKRQKFLNKYLDIIYLHLDGKWYFETRPVVNLIIMNPDLSKALLHFNTFDSGGDVYLEKKDGYCINLDGLGEYYVRIEEYKRCPTTE